MEENPNPLSPPTEIPPTREPYQPIPQAPTGLTPQPAASPNPPVQPAQQFPVSASQMGLDRLPEKRFNLKRLLVPGIFALAAIVILAGGWLIFKSMSGFGTITVQADGFTYTVKYNKTAKGVIIKNLTYMEGKDPVTHNAILLNVAKAVQSKRDCDESGTGKIIDTPIVEGEKHNLCYLESRKLYGMAFKHNNEWFTFTMFPKVSGSDIDAGTVKMVAASVNIN